MYAAIQGDETMILRLLKNNANRDFIDSKGKTAAFWASSKNYDSVVSLINNDPKKVSIFDVIANGDLQSTIALLKQGIDVNIKRNYFKSSDSIASPLIDGIHLETPLICATRYQRIDIVTLLCKAPDIKINDSDCNAKTALFYASIANNEDIIITLLKKGATSTYYDINGETIKNYKLL
jgi:ankyrin repeat protein